MTKAAGNEKEFDFAKLLQESRQLNARIRAGGHDNVFLPQLQRGLEQIEELSSQLAAKITAASGEIRQSLEPKAALFLATKGYDVGSVSAQLRKVADIVPGSASQAAIPFDADVDSFLQGELDMAVLGTLNRVEARMVIEAERIIRERSEATWDKCMTAMADYRRTIQPGQDTISGISEAPSGPKMATYSRVIRAFNEARLKGYSLNLPREFETSLSNLEGHDPRADTLIDSWRALQFILDSAENADNVFEVKNYAPSYLADLKSPSSKTWKAQLIQGSRKFLEDMYLRFVDRTLTQYPRDALLGGRPSAMERVRAFCDIKLKRMPPSELANLEIINASPIWLHLFSLVRCGLLKDALSLAQSIEHIIQRSDPLFFSFFKAFVTSPGHQISGTLLSQLRLEYNQQMNTGNDGKKQDPYKMALLKICGHCDLARKTVTEVITTSEDYLWLQFWLIQDSLVEDVEGESAYTLADLQRIITEFGSRHFDPKSNNPWQFFIILSLVGLFEMGIEHLHQRRQVIDAAHFAIAFLQAGTLRLATTTESSPFIKQRQGATISINFGSLIVSYASSLSSGDINDSVNYLLLLSLSKNGEYDTLCHTSMRDIILKSGDYGPLLGDVRHDGSIVSGKLSHYARLMNLRDSKAFMEIITAAAAAKCDKEGHFREALQLYNLANKYDKVLDVLCSRLCRAFSGPYVALESDELRRTAESILNYYTAQGHIISSISSASRSTCGILIQLLQLRKLVEESQWAEATDILLKLSSILPLEGDVANISSAADRIKEMSDSLTVILPELLVMAMSIIVSRYGELGIYIGIDSGRAQQAEILRRMARNLLTFVGMLRLRVPQEVYAQLTRLESSL